MSNQKTVSYKINGVGREVIELEKYLQLGKKVVRDSRIICRDSENLYRDFNGLYRLCYQKLDTFRILNYSVKSEVDDGRVVEEEEKEKELRAKFELNNKEELECRKEERDTKNILPIKNLNKKKQNIKKRRPRVIVWNAWVIDTSSESSSDSEND